MIIAFVCPGCKNTLQVSAASAGLPGKCPGCGTSFRVPLPDTGVQAAPAQGYPAGSSMRPAGSSRPTSPVAGKPAHRRAAGFVGRSRQSRSAVLPWLICGWVLLTLALVVAVIMLLLPTGEPGVRPRQAAVNPRPTKPLPKNSPRSHARRVNQARSNVAARLPPQPEPPPVWRGHTSQINTVTFSPQGDLVITAAGTPDNSVRIWDARTGREVKRCLEKFTDPIYSIAFSPDGHYALFGCGGYWKSKTEYVRGTDYLLRLWDLEKDEEMTSKLAVPKDNKIPRLAGHTDEVFCVAISPDGKRAASGSRDLTLRVWDLRTGKQLQCMRGHQDSIYHVAFSPDGRRLLTASADCTARLWDVEAGSEIRTLKGHTDLVWAAAFSPDGRYALTGAGQQLDLKNRSNGVPQFTDGSKDYTVRRWDLAMGKEVQCFRGHTGAVWRVVPTPDGRRIVSTGQDCSVRVWDVATGKEVACFWGHAGVIRGLAVSPGGRYALSGSLDQTLRVWKLPPSGAGP